MITSVHLFDFDSTLFRSPEPPPSYPDPVAWWADPASMSPPYVPARPGNDYWIAKAVQGLQRAATDPSSYTAVVTARMFPLRRRVTELLHQKGLRPDEVILNETEHGASQYKIHEMAYLARSFPTAHTIEFWEDKAGDLKGFERYAVRRLGLKFVPHLIRSTRMPSLIASASRVASRHLG